MNIDEPSDPIWKTAPVEFEGSERRVYRIVIASEVNVYMHGCTCAFVCSVLPLQVFNYTNLCVTSPIESGTVTALHFGKCSILIPIDCTPFSGPTYPGTQPRVGKPKSQSTL